MTDPNASQPGKSARAPATDDAAARVGKLVKQRPGGKPVVAAPEPDDNRGVGLSGG